MIMRVKVPSRLVYVFSILSPFSLTFILPLIFYPLPMKYTLDSKFYTIPNHDIYFALALATIWISIISLVVLWPLRKKPTVSYYSWSKTMTFWIFLSFSIIGSLILLFHTFFIMPAGFEAIFHQLSLLPLLSIIIGIDVIKWAPKKIKIFSAILLTFTFLLCFLLPISTGNIGPILFAAVTVWFALMYRHESLITIISFIIVCFMILYFGEMYKTQIRYILYSGNFSRTPIFNYLPIKRSAPTVINNQTFLRTYKIPYFNQQQDLQDKNIHQFNTNTQLLPTPAIPYIDLNAFNKELALKKAQTEKIKNTKQQTSLKPTANTQSKTKPAVKKSTKLKPTSSSTRNQESTFENNYQEEEPLTLPSTFLSPNTNNQKSQAQNEASSITQNNSSQAQSLLQKKLQALASSKEKRAKMRYNYIHLFDSEYYLMRFQPFLKKHPDMHYGIARIVNRMDHLIELGNVVEQTPSEIPFAHGDTYMPLLFIFIPRMIWHNKPNDNTGQYFGHRYGILIPQDTSTSINLPVLTEGWMNFGWFGIIISALLLGYLFRLIWFYLIGEYNTFDTLIIAMVVVHTAVNLESSSFLLIGGIYQTLIIYLIIKYMIRKADQYLEEKKKLIFDQ